MHLAGVTTMSTEVDLPPCDAPVLGWLLPLDPHEANPAQMVTKPTASALRRKLLNPSRRPVNIRPTPNAGAHIPRCSPG
jgi:hypothetical protein